MAHALLIKTTLVLLLAWIALTPGCGRSSIRESGGGVKVIRSGDHFTEVKGASSRLIVFDLYAEWCGPCRTLSPMLEEIAVESAGKADFYKINVDELPDLAASFNVTGIPCVVFMKDKKVIHSLTGLYPKSAYMKAIVLYAPGEPGSGADAETQPDGELVNGVRVIKFAADITPRNIYVYEGESINIVIAAKGYVYSVHLPAFGVSESSTGEKELIVSFKAERTGVFPIFCNGDCPAGDGAMHARIFVMRASPPANNAIFQEITAPLAHERIKQGDLLILDVRSPNEFYQGFIPGALLIPLQQLHERLPEIENYKEKEILIYCRSGRRSAVASELLIQKGFRKVFNLKGGVNAWMQENFEIRKELPSRSI